MFGSLKFLAITISIISLCMPGRSNLASKPGKDPEVNFTLIDSNGKSVSLSDFRGKFVIISFQANWCTPCLREIKPTKDYQAFFQNKNVVWIFVSFDREVKLWKEARDNDNLKGIHLWGKPESENLKRTFKFDSLPYYVWIDEDGTIALDDAPRPSSRLFKSQLSVFVH